MRKFTCSRSVLALTLCLFFLQAVASTYEWTTVKRVIDGDTIELEGGTKVRLIGVDTPETVDPRKPVEYFGKEASDFTKSQLEGNRVRLEYDWQRVDKYGRTLAYVYQEDGTLFNAKIIALGYAHAYTKYPFKQELMDLFRSLERDAREHHRGLWKDDTTQAAALPVLTPILTDSLSTASQKKGTDAQYWINTRSGVRHNSKCKWYGNTREGHYTTDKSEGKACGICGG